MAESDKLFAGSIPETYDRFLVPLIFESYARDLAERVAKARPSRVLATLFPADPPPFMARTPHGYHDVEKIRADLTAAGFASIAVEPLEYTSKAPSPRDVAIAYCQGTPLRNEIEARDATGLDRATQVAADALAGRFGSGAVEGRIQAHVITANG